MYGYLVLYIKERSVQTMPVSIQDFRVPKLVSQNFSLSKGRRKALPAPSLCILSNHQLITNQYRFFKYCSHTNLKTIKTLPYSAPLNVETYWRCKHLSLALTSSIICNKVHVTVTKSRGPNCVGPFKRPEVPYHDRKELVQFFLYNSQIWLTLDSQFKICSKAPILLGHPEKLKSVVYNVGRECR